MKRPTSYYRRQQRLPVFVGLLLFNLVLVLIQLWLFVSVLENLLDNKPAMSVPAAIVSATCLGVNIWMLVGLRRLDRQN